MDVWIQSLQIPQVCSPFLRKKRVALRNALSFVSACESAGVHTMANSPV